MTAALLPVHTLLAELNRLGIIIEAVGDRLRYSPKAAVTPDLSQRMQSHKSAILAALSGASWEPYVSSDANETNWQAIDDADREYLLRPRDWPAPCAWCGGRLVHSPACKELRQQCVPTIPFGRHRGRRADELPADYIDWLVSKSIGSESFRHELQQWQADK